MSNKNLSAVLHSMKLINSVLMNEKKAPAASPMDEFHKYHHYYKTGKIKATLNTETAKKGSMQPFI